MTSTDERDAKRHITLKVNSPSYSVDTDIEVEVEDEVIGVHSLLLMMLSPVFKQMLTHKMKESSSSRITLPGKKKNEFMLFWEMIQPLSTKQLDDESAIVLARWSDEYQVQALKDKCEMHLLSSEGAAAQPVVWQQCITLAHECSLPKLLNKCTDIGKELVEAGDYTFITKLRDMGAGIPEDTIKNLWPIIRKKSMLPESAMKEMPDISHVRAMWPFVVSAISTDNIKHRWLYETKFQAMPPVPSGLAAKRRRSGA